MAQQKQAAQGKPQASPASVIIKTPKADNPVTASQILQLPNNVTLELVYIPAGEFLMGSPEIKGSTDEFPQHKVTVPAFYLGKYPVTQAQYQAVMGQNLSNFKGDNRPVEVVSWHDVTAFCAKLSALTHTNCRLPTEAEWEYACRAGTTSRYWFGDNEDELEKYAWYKKNSVKFLLFGETSEVGQKPANPFGLYDMHGNVCEWCEDIWHDDYRGAPTDARAWVTDGDQSRRVLRSSASKRMRESNRGGSRGVAPSRDF